MYDATTADDAIQLERLNLLVVGADQGVVQFMEMGSLVNSGDRTFVTANPQDQALAHAIKFALPSGALGVQMQTGFSDQDVIPGVGGVQVTSPVPPGRHEFALSFQLPYTGSSADVSMQMPYPTGTLQRVPARHRHQARCQRPDAGRPGSAGRPVVRAVQRQQSGQGDDGRRPALRPRLDRRARDRTSWR